MNNSFYHIISLIAIGFLGSCTDVVDVDVPDGGDRLVVEATIEWEKGTTGQEQVISLSTSTPYFADNTDVPATGASVQVVKDNDGAVFVFEDQGDGDYVCNNFEPEIDASYTLEIDYKEQHYTAQETLISVVDIKEVTQTTEDGFSDEDAEITLFFDDPLGVRNHYLTAFKLSNKPLVSLQALSDQFTDGNENFDRYEDEDLEPGVVVNAKLQGISEAYYNYISILIEQVQSFGGPFATTPVQLKGNCFNVDNADEEVLGFFRLSEVVSVEHVVE